MRSLFVIPPLMLLVSCSDGIGPAGPAASATIVSGNGQTQTAGQELPEPLVVLVKDADGRPVPGHAVTFLVTAGEGRVQVGRHATTADGTAEERWVLGTKTADSQVVEVRWVGPATGQDQVFARFRAVAAPDVAARLFALFGDLQQGGLGEPLPDSIRVAIADRYGNPVPGAPVLWRVLGGEGTVSADSTTTAANGRAATRWVLGPRLDTTHVLQASSPGLSPVRFTATPYLPVGAAIVKIAGDAQADSVGRRLADSLVVEVRLADGRPVAGVPVSWSASGMGRVYEGSERTGPAGRAAAAWTLGWNWRVDQRDQYAVAGIDSARRVVFEATALFGPGAITVVSGDSQLGWVDMALDLPIRVRTFDDQGSPLAGSSAAFVALTGGGWPFEPASLNPTGDTIAVAWHLGPLLGEQTMDAYFLWFGDTIRLARPLVATAHRVVRWLGSAGVADWTDAAMWSIADVPAAEDLAIVSLSGSYTITVTRDHALGKLLSESGSGDRRLRVDAGGSLTVRRGKLNSIRAEVTGGRLEIQEAFGDGVIHLRDGSVGGRKLEVAFVFGGGRAGKRVRADTISMPSAVWENAGGTLLLEGGPHVTVSGGARFHWSEDSTLAAVRIESADGRPVTIQTAGLWEWDLETTDRTPPALVLDGPTMTWTNPLVLLAGVTEGAGVVHDLVLLEGGAALTTSGPIPAANGWTFLVNPEAGVGLRAVYGGT